MRKPACSVFLCIQYHISKKLANSSSPVSPLTKEGHENKYDSDGGGKGRGSRFCDPKGEERGEGKRETDGCKRKRERGLEMIPQLDIKRLLFSLPFLHIRSLGHTEEGGGGFILLSG